MKVNAATLMAFAHKVRRCLRTHDEPASRTVAWLIGFFAFLNVYSIQSVLPLIGQEFQVSPVQAGMTVGATVLAVALVSPFMGMLSDAMGRKRVLCTALLALTVPTALISVSNGLGMVIFLRFLQGLVVPGIVVVMMAYLAEEFGTVGMARMTATYVGGTVMGGFCGRFITGHAGHWLGWRGAFLMLAAMNLFGALLVIWRLPPSRHFVPRREASAALRTLWLHLHNPRLRAACAVGFCVLFSLVGTFTYVNFLLAAPPFNFSPASLANVFFVYLAGVVVTPLAGRIIPRWGLLPTLLGALALSISGLLLTLLSPLMAVIAGLTLCSSGVFVCQAATISFVGASVREGRSLATGMYNMSYYAGGAVGTWLAGLAYENWGWGGSVLSVAIVQLLAGGIAWFGWRQPA